MHRFGGQWSLLGAMLIVAAGAGAQEDDASGWIARMNDAVEQLNYRGRYVHVQGEEAETLYIVHAYDNGHVSERLLSLDGAGREIVRDGDIVRCILPDRETVLLESGRTPSPLSVLSNYSDTVAANYSFQLHKTARIADRRTRIVSIMPRDKLRYGYRLWLDDETAMPLKSQLIDENDEIVEQVFFTDIEIKIPIRPAELEPTINDEGFTLVSDRPLADPAASEPVSLTADDLPPGFSLSVASRGSMAGSRYPVDHLVFSDGLATVSVFVEDRKSSREIAAGHSRLGTANAFSTSFQGRRVTAVGEVPQRTVESIARSLRSQ
jgi:sigma-E factor negative regulatory protein RseB